MLHQSHPNATSKPPQSHLKATFKLGARLLNCLDCAMVPAHECGDDDLCHELRGLIMNHTTLMKRTTSARAPDRQRHPARPSAFGLPSAFPSSIGAPVLRSSTAEGGLRR